MSYPCQLHEQSKELFKSNSIYLQTDLAYLLILDFLGKRGLDPSSVV
jgi:hypothetical protein